MRTVLVVGGYGNVGSRVSELLTQEGNVNVIVSGRDETRAKAAATPLKADWRRIDLLDQRSIPAALAGVDLVINCFSGPFTGTPLFLPAYCTQAGIHYLDVAGSYEYNERFLQLYQTAAASQSVLITALGVNPGIPGILLMNAAGQFETLESGRAIFVLGAKMDGISVSSLKELKYMMDVPALVWERDRWRKPQESWRSEPIGRPFDKNIYIGPALTRDLLVIPELTGIQALSFWSGSQDSLQGLVMIFGLRLGLTRGDKPARFLLNLLKMLGNRPRSLSDMLLQVEVSGKVNGVRRSCTTSLTARKIMPRRWLPSLYAARSCPARSPNAALFSHSR